jgi:hypothetical protein
MAEKTENSTVRRMISAPPTLAIVAPSKLAVIHCLTMGRCLPTSPKSLEQ